MSKLKKLDRNLFQGLSQIIEQRTNGDKKVDTEGR